MKVSFDLWDTIDQSPHIEEVYFSRDNKHFFNKHELDGKYYGFLKVQQVKSHSVGDKQYFKLKKVANPATEIVETMTREEILDSVPMEESEIFTTSRSRARAKADKAKAAKDSKKAKQPAE